MKRNLFQILGHYLTAKSQLREERDNAVIANLRLEEKYLSQPVDPGPLTTWQEWGDTYIADSSHTEKPVPIHQQEWLGADAGIAQRWMFYYVDNKKLLDDTVKAIKTKPVLGRVATAMLVLYNNAETTLDRVLDDGRNRRQRGQTEANKHLSLSR